MEAYEYVIKLFVAIAIFGLALLISKGLYVGSVELYDAIRQGRMTWSHIQAAGLLVAGYVVSMFQKQKPGRHAQGHVVFWREVRNEFENAPYSLMRADNNVHALKYATHA